MHVLQSPYLPSSTSRTISFLPPRKTFKLLSLSLSHITHSYARDFSRVLCSFDCSLSSMADQRDQHPNSPAGTSLNYLLLLLFSSQSTTSSIYKRLDTWSSWFRCRRINSSPEEKFSRKTQNRNSFRFNVEKSSSRYVSKPETTYRSVQLKLNSQNGSLRRWSCLFSSCLFDDVILNLLLPVMQKIQRREKWLKNRFLGLTEEPIPSQSQMKLLTLFSLLSKGKPRQC